MSAWHVSMRHIQVIVEAMFKYEFVTLDMGDAQSIGKKLFCENYRSINHRYEERRRAPSYVHDSVGVQGFVQDPMTVFKTVQCYKYQSSEHPAWEKSQVCQWMEAFSEHVCVVGLKMTQDEAYKDPRWAEAPWGID